MANQDDEPTDGRAPWTIKGMSVEARKLAVRRARMRDVSVGAWMETAITNQANLEAGDQVMPPPPPRARANLPGVPAVYEPPPELGDLADLMRAAQGVAEAASMPIPKTTARHALALMTAQFRAARGLPPLGRHRATALGMARLSFLSAHVAEELSSRW
jgi:hypothetical protein